MQRRLIALAAGMAVGLYSAAPALAAPTLAATGDATSITTTTADLNGAVYRDRVGARWLFELSPDPGFDMEVLTTTPEPLHGRLVAVERQVNGLLPGTEYFWRIVVAVREGTRTVQTAGAVHSLETASDPAPAPAPTVAPSSGS